MSENLHCFSTYVVNERIEDALSAGWLGVLERDSSPPLQAIWLLACLKFRHDTARFTDISVYSWFVTSNYSWFVTCAQLTGAAVVPAATTAPGGQTTQLPNGQTAATNPNNALALTGPNAGGANAGASKVRTESAAQIAAANPQSNVFNSDVKTAASNPGG